MSCREMCGRGCINAPQARILRRRRRSMSRLMRHRRSFSSSMSARSGLMRIYFGVEGDLGSDQTVLRQKLLVTEREAEVLLWIARGKSNRDIAEILNLSPRTVNKHLEQIYAKLGVENRTSAAALAVRALGVR
jgi:DNA-binding CsgD family transcriptional regulator